MARAQRWTERPARIRELVIYEIEASVSIPSPAANAAFEAALAELRGSDDRRRGMAMLRALAKQPHSCGMAERNALFCGCACDVGLLRQIVELLTPQLEDS